MAISCMSEITYESIYNCLELLKSEFPDILDILEYCQDVISDERLLYYPEIDLLNDDSIQFNYECHDEDNLSIDHLTLNISSAGADFDDKIISYFCIKGDETDYKSNLSWNEMIKVINEWHIK